MHLSRERRILVTVGIMTGMLLAALEATVVATAMPKVIASLGGLAIYSWVFSIYLLTSTVSLPIWGKLSDLYGRRLCYQVGITVFLLGSVLSGMSQSMNQLILFRAIQGLGAGALVPIALTIIGEIYTLEERARMQGLFSSVWGISSIAGPLLGGFIADRYSWRWIFYINIPFGIIAALIIGFALVPTITETPVSKAPPKIDISGAITLTIAITLLLLACLEMNHPNNIFGTIGLFAGAGLFLALFIRTEQRSPEPLLPLHLFRMRMFSASSLGNFLAGCALFGMMSFVPLFLQGVMGTDSTTAGKPVMILLLGWVAFSGIGGRLILHFGYRPLVIFGMSSLATGLGMLCLLTTTLNHIYISLAIIGVGMGLSMFSLLMAVQNTVPRNHLGVATSATQFFRNIGGAIGTAIMGSLMSLGLTSKLAVMQDAIKHQGLEQDVARIVADPNIILNPVVRDAIPAAAIGYFRESLANGLHWVFVLSFIIGIGALISALLVPAGQAIDNREKKISIEPSAAD